LDKIDLPNVHIIWDLEKTPLPFGSDSVSEIIIEHVLEHITNMIPLLEEFHRICKPGSIIRIYVPYYRYEGAFRDPTHVRFFSENTFEYFTDGYTYDFYSKARFKVRKRELKTTSKTKLRTLNKKIINYIPLKKFLNIFLWNLYTEIYFELEVVK